MITRRNFLQSMIVLAASGYPKNILALENKERALNLHNIHTGEKLAVDYYSSGAYDRNALNEINRIMRCHFNNELKPIDVSVLDLLCDIKDSIGKNRELLIISGYRSHAYNDYLRKSGRDVVSNSLHLTGRAIDFRIPGFDISKLAVIAKSFSAGGVGKYQAFIHIDNGRVRYW